MLDVGLPDISGLDVCTSLSNSNNAYILMVSGHSREQDILLGLGLGADDYITKPFSGNELVARIASFLRRREKFTQKKEGARARRSERAARSATFIRSSNDGEERPAHRARISFAVVLWLRPKAGS